jgi:transcription elongation factor GreB
VGSIPASRTKKAKACNESCRLFRFSVSSRLFPFFTAASIDCYSVHDMNKAFTRETEGDDEDLELAPLPAGGKNYMTREGYERLRAELLGLIDDERPKIVEIVHWAASNGDRSENGDYHYGKKRLREIDRRIRFLTQRLELAEISDPSIHHGSDQIFFGATVRYSDDAGVERTITILGIDEASSSTQQVSWISPVARALLKARIGDEVSFTTPSGVHTLEVLDVQYPAPSSSKL